jgi:hypothetical protein
MLVEDYITRNIYAIGRNVEALVAFVHETIADEDALMGMVIEFGSVIRSEAGQHAHPKTLSWEYVGGWFMMVSRGVDECSERLGNRLMR